MKKTVLLDKKIGQTPLEAIELWKAHHPNYANVAASYAGRLDPMASGKLLVLLGEECKRQQEYIGLDKTYEIEVLLDVGSDTGDILGIVTRSPQETMLTRSDIKRILGEEVGTHTRPYPIYSSKTVAGKPLFLYALEGTLDTIEIPMHEETIHSIRYRGSSPYSTRKLKQRIASLLALAPTSDQPSKALGADFRIEAVKKSWQEVFEHDRPYRILKLKVACGSGTYMRALAGRIGETLGSKALALSIRRTKIVGI
ncbi:MAG: truB [Parcubacteria group bacterium]|nr:truB [Parcubacteria group bacterium]